MSMSGEDWLSDEFLGRFRDTLATDGWDDQARLEAASDEDCVELVKRFEKPGLKLKFRLTLEKLRGRKIDLDAKPLVPSSSQEDVKLPEPVAAVAIAAEPVVEPVAVVAPTPAPAADVVDPDLPAPAAAAVAVETPSTPPTVVGEPVVTPSPSLAPADNDEVPPPVPPPDTPSVGPIAGSAASVPSLVGDDVAPPAQTNLPALPDDASDDDSGDSDDESANKRKSTTATGTSTPTTAEPQEALTITHNDGADPDPTSLPPAIQAPGTPQPGSSDSSAAATPTTGDDKGAKFKTASGANTPTKVAAPAVPVVIAASASDPKEKRPEVKKLVIPAPGRTTEVKKTEAGPVGMNMKDRQAAFLATAKKDVAGQTAKATVLPKAAGGRDEFRSKAEGLALVFGASVPGLRPAPTTKKYRAVEEEEIDDNDETGDEVSLRCMLPAAADITNGPQESGRLEKRGSTKAPWKKRYCLVKDDCFYWLKNEDEPRPLGMVKLSEPGVKFKQSGDECEITTSRRSYFIKAEDEDRMEHWIKKFRVGKLAVVAARAEGATSSGLAGFVKSGPPSASQVQKLNEEKAAQYDDDEDDAAAAMAMLKARDQADRQAAGVSPTAGDEGSDDEGNKGARKGGNKSAASSRRNSGERSGANSRKNSSDGKGVTSPTASDAKKNDEKKAATPRKDDDSSEAKQHKQLLITGTLFLKYKRKSPKKRMIHANKEFDSILWSDEKKKKEKGRMAISDLKSVKDGCPGAKNNANAITVMFTTRTLELEALTPQHKTAWVAALNWLISSR